MVRGHSITTLTTFCTFLTTYLSLLTYVDNLGTIYLMSTLTSREVTPIIFSRNTHLILISILWISVLDFVNISKWQTLIISAELNNSFFMTSRSSEYIFDDKTSKIVFYVSFCQRWHWMNHLCTYSWHWLTFYQVPTYPILST